MHATYPPLNQLKPVCEDLWVVDGPLIRYGIGRVKFSFPTRMTIIRIGSALFLHSPTHLTPELVAEVRAIGAPVWLIGPNRIHYWWIPEWKHAFPSSQVYLAPGITEQSQGRVDFDSHRLAGRQGYPWDSRIATLPVASGYMTEFVFFDRPTRTLILTDLIENFEPSKLGSPLLRWLARAGGVQDPHGSMPRDMRLTFWRHREQLRAAVRQMIDWQPERVILAHGRWYQSNGVAELERAFRWLLA